MNRAARTFWSMYYINLLKRENMISQEEFSELTRNADNFPLYNNRITEYNNCETAHMQRGGVT